MQENFENRIKKQVDDFELTPNEFVWEEIEAKLNQKKKKRFAFWFWTGLVGILMVGFGIWGMHSKHNVAANETTSYIQIRNKTTEFHSRKTLVTSIKNITTDTTQKTFLKRGISQISTEVKNSIYSKKERKDAFVNNKNNVQSNKYKQHSVAQSSELTSIKTGNKGYANFKMKSNSSATSFIDSGNIQSNSDTNCINDTQRLAAKTITNEKEIIPVKDVIKTNKKKLKVFLELGVGAFSANTSVHTNQYSSISYNNPTTSVGDTTFRDAKFNSRSKIGFAIKGGIAFRKQLSKKWQLQTGLNYLYFQNKITVGERYDSVKFSDDGHYFVAGNKDLKCNYTHSFQVPIQLNYLLGTFYKQDFYLEFGGNIGYQLQSNWLVSENNYGMLYYKKSLKRNVWGAVAVGVNTTLKNNLLMSIGLEQAITPLNTNDKINTNYKTLYFKVGIPLK